MTFALKYLYLIPMKIIRMSIRTDPKGIYVKMSEFKIFPLECFCLVCPYEYQEMQWGDNFATVPVFVFYFHWYFPFSCSVSIPIDVNRCSMAPIMKIKTVQIRNTCCHFISRRSHPFYHGVNR